MRTIRAIEDTADQAATTTLDKVLGVKVVEHTADYRVSLFDLRGQRVKSIQGADLSLLRAEIVSYTKALPEYSYTTQEYDLAGTALVQGIPARAAAKYPRFVGESLDTYWSRVQEMRGADAARKRTERAATKAKRADEAEYLMHSHPMPQTDAVRHVVATHHTKRATKADQGRMINPMVPRRSPITGEGLDIIATLTERFSKGFSRAKGKVNGNFLSETRLAKDAKHARVYDIMLASGTASNGNPLARVSYSVGVPAADRMRGHYDTYSPTLDDRYLVCVRTADGETVKRLRGYDLARLMRRANKHLPEGGAIKVSEIGIKQVAHPPVQETRHFALGKPERESTTPQTVTAEQGYVVSWMPLARFQWSNGVAVAI